MDMCEDVLLHEGNYKRASGRQMIEGSGDERIEQKPEVEKGRSEVKEKYE
jgi:hypothetical protein